MSHTVAITGVNGNVGQKALPYLVKAAQEDKIKLVVFHRKSSRPKNVEAGKNIEFRALNFDDPAEELQKAVKGINVFVSTVGFEGLPQEPAVVEALAKSPDFVTYIPPTYSIPWAKEDYADPNLGPILKFIHTPWDRATELRIAVTPIYTSVFDIYWFQYGFLASSLQSGEVVANEKHLKNRLPITSLDHLGQTIAHIATSDPQTVKDREFHCVTYWPTGDELVALHTELLGKAPQIKEYTPALRQEQIADGQNFGAAKVGYWDRWENDSFSFEQDSVEYHGPGLEETAKQFV